jgi:enoyl-CoA hydratase
MIKKIEIERFRTANHFQEDPMNADVLTTKVADGIAVITLGSARRIYFDEEMGDALTEALDGFAGDASVRVVVITGGAPGYFNRHFDVGVLIGLAESLRASGREWPENATYNGGFFDKAMALCESMPKPVIAAISGTALAGAFEFALSCDLRIAEDGVTSAGSGRLHQASRPQRHRDAAGRGTGTRKKSLPETVYQRTRTRAHAFLCGGEHHLAVALYCGRRRLNHD